MKYGAPIIFNPNNGFSLTELLLAIFLLGILAAIAVPNFQPILLQNRVDAQVLQLTSMIQYARTEAIRRGEIIILCHSADQKTCSGHWEDGQIVIADKSVLRVYGKVPNSDGLKLFGSFGKNNQLEFLPQGFTNGQRGSFYYCPANKEYARRIVIESTGRTRVEKNNSRC